MSDIASTIISAMYPSAAKPSPRPRPAAASATPKSLADQMYTHPTSRRGAQS
jgi:hypothetical protein